MAGNQDAEPAEGAYRDCYDKWIVALSAEGFRHKENIDLLADELAGGEFEPDCQAFKAIITQGSAERFLQGMHVLDSMMPTCDMWVANGFMKRVLGLSTPPILATPHQAIIVGAPGSASDGSLPVSLADSENYNPALYQLINASLFPTNFPYPASNIHQMPCLNLTYIPSLN
jgi:hypothetical protein